MDLARQNYSLLHNFFYCALQTPASADGKLEDDSVRKNMKRWMSGEASPTKRCLLKIPYLPEEMQQLIKKSKQTRNGTFRPEVASYASLPMLTRSFFMCEDTFFPMLACHVEFVGQLLLSRPSDLPPTDKILLPEPYRAMFIEWCSFGDDRRLSLSMDEYRLRLESLLLFIAIREAGLIPQNRVVLKTLKGLSEQRNAKRESLKASFFKVRGNCGYTIWKVLARRVWDRKYPSKKPTTVGLQRCYDKGTFYAKLAQPWFDRPFLSQVLCVYHDHVLNYPADSENRDTIVDLLLLSLLQLQTLDWLLKHRPREAHHIPFGEVVEHLESYIEFAIKTQQLPAFSPDKLDAIDKECEKRFWNSAQPPTA